MYTRGFFLSNRAAGARKFWIFGVTQNQDSDNCDCFAPQAPKNEVKTSLRWQYYDNRAITRSQTMSLAPPYLVASGGPKGGGQTQGTPLMSVINEGIENIIMHFFGPL